MAYWHWETLSTPFMKTKRTRAEKLRRATQPVCRDANVYLSKSRLYGLQQAFRWNAPDLQAIIRSLRSRSIATTTTSNSSHNWGTGWQNNNLVQTSSFHFPRPGHWCDKFTKPMSTKDGGLFTAKKWTWISCTPSTRQMTAWPDGQRWIWGLRRLAWPILQRPQAPMTVTTATTAMTTVNRTFGTRAAAEAAMVLAGGSLRPPAAALRWIRTRPAALKPAPSQSSQRPQPQQGQQHSSSSGSCSMRFLWA